MKPCIKQITRSKAFTLVEVVLASAVALLAMGAMLTVIVTSAQFAYKNQRLEQATTGLRSIQDFLNQELSVAVNRVRFPNQPANTANIRPRYYYLGNSTARRTYYAGQVDAATPGSNTLTLKAVPPGVTPTPNDFVLMDNPNLGLEARIESVSDGRPALATGDVTIRLRRKVSDYAPTASGVAANTVATLQRVLPVQRSRMLSYRVALGAPLQVTATPRTSNVLVLPDVPPAVRPRAGDFALIDDPDLAGGIQIASVSDSRSPNSSGTVTLTLARTILAGTVGLPRDVAETVRVEIHRQRAFVIAEPTPGAATTQLFWAETSTYMDDDNNGLDDTRNYRVLSSFDPDTYRQLSDNISTDLVFAFSQEPNDPSPAQAAANSGVSWELSYRVEAASPGFANLSSNQDFYLTNYASSLNLPKSGNPITLGTIGAPPVIRNSSTTLGSTTSTTTTTLGKSTTSTAKSTTTTTIDQSTTTLVQSTSSTAQSTTTTTVEKSTSTTAKSTTTTSLANSTTTIFLDGG